MKHWIWALALVSAGSVWAAPEWVRGIVVKVEPEKTRITIKHQPIETIGMAAMTMPFRVVDGVSLNAVKPGDKVRFTVQELDDHLKITALEPAK